MSTWILIIMFSGSGKAITTQEFSSRETCVIAADTVIATSSLGFNLYAICVKK